MRTSAESWAPRPFGSYSPDGVSESFVNFLLASASLSMITPLPSLSFATALLASTASGDFGFSDYSAAASGVASDFSGAASVLLSRGSS